eukprot:184569-Rhodomonas_salina.1
MSGSMLRVCCAVACSELVLRRVWGGAGGEGEGQRVSDALSQRGAGREGGEERGEGGGEGGGGQGEGGRGGGGREEGGRGREEGGEEEGDGGLGQEGLWV